MKDIFEYTQECQILGANIIGECIAGEIWRKQLNRPHKNEYHLIPEAITQLIGTGVTNAEQHRRGLATKMHNNEPNLCPIIGMPSSAFGFITSDLKILIDFVCESSTFVRNPNVTIHTYMVDFDRDSGFYTYHQSKLMERQSFWSGHIALLTSTYQNLSYGHLMLLDKFSRKSDQLRPIESFFIASLYENGIIPVNSRGQIIEYQNNERT